MRPGPEISDAPLCSLSLWEWAGVRVFRTIAVNRKREDPHPRPLPKGEGEDSRAGFGVLPILLLIIAFLSTTASAASVTVDFPLDGHYRIGRYMPAHVTAEAADVAATSLRLRSDQVVTTELPLAGGKADATLPWLSVRGDIAQGSWSLESESRSVGQGALPALKPLADDERLVAWTDGDPDKIKALCAALMPDKKVVPVRLDLNRPLLAPACAYESLDLLVLGPAALPRVKESAVISLLAGGTAVLVRSDERPVGDWPWRKLEDRSASTQPLTWWLLDHATVGPRSIVDMEAYAPTYGWEHGWHSGIRKRVLLLAVLSAIVLLGVSLWRSRFAAWAAIALCALVTAGVLGWSHRQSPLLSAGGSLVEWDGSICQHDQWAYRSALRESTVLVPWNLNAQNAEGSAASHFVTKPIFYNALQIRQTEVKLVCDATGRPDHFSAHLVTDGTIGFLGRSLAPVPPEYRPVDRITPVTPDTAAPLKDDDAGSALTSPLYVLADQLYPGRVTGRVIDPGRAATDPGHWQSIFIDDEGSR